MRILLDENLPRGLRDALAEGGHEVESVHSKHLDGIANGALYELAQREYDLLFTRDDEFSRRARDKKTASSLKVIRVTIPQTRQDVFVAQFIRNSQETTWAAYANGDEWPRV